MTEKQDAVKKPEIEAQNARAAGNIKLTHDILAHIAQLPELQALWASLPPHQQVSGYEREQDTWLRLLGHLPLYSLRTAIEDMIWDALPDVMRDLVHCARDC